MAVFTVTLTTGAIHCLGPQKATKWGSPMQWGTDQWAYDTHTTGNFGLPLLVNSYHDDLGPIFATVGNNGYGSLPYVNTATISNGSGQAEYLKDKNGYFHVLGGGNTNDDSYSPPIYTPVPRVYDTWTPIASSPASWVAK